VGRSEVAEAELETAQELEFGETSTNPGLHPSCTITTNKYFELGIGENFTALNKNNRKEVSLSTWNPYS